MQYLDAIFDVLVEVPGEFSRWATTMNDGSFVRIMFVGAVILTFVVARALR